MADHDAWGRRPLIIELADEGFENRLGRFAAAMVGIVRPVAVVAARPEKEHLYTRGAAGLLYRDHVGVADTFEVDVLV